MNTALLRAMPSRFSPDNVHVVNYMMNTVFSGPINKQVICRDHMTDMFTVGQYGLQKISMDELQDISDGPIKMFKYLGDHSSYQNILENISLSGSIFKGLLGEEIDSIENDGRFEEEIPTCEMYAAVERCIEATILSKLNSTNDIEVPIVELAEVEEGTGISYCRDINGIFLQNTNIGIRSASYESAHNIPIADKKILGVQTPTSH